MGCIAAGVAAFFSWVLLAIPAWAVVVVYVRDGRGAAFRLAVGAAAGVVAVTLLLAAVWGYDPIAIFRAVHHAYGGGRRRPPSVRVLAVRLAGGMDHAARPSDRLAGAAVATARASRPPSGLAVIVVISAVAGFTKAETERIWLPYVPLACAAAAATPITRLRPWLIAMALMALVIEVLFGTIW